MSKSLLPLAKKAYYLVKNYSFSKFSNYNNKSSKLESIKNYREYKDESSFLIRKLINTPREKWNCPNREVLNNILWELYFAIKNSKASQWYILQIMNQNLDQDLNGVPIVDLNAHGFVIDYIIMHLLDRRGATKEEKYYWKQRLHKLHVSTFGYGIQSSRKLLHTLLGRVEDIIKLLKSTALEDARVTDTEQTTNILSSEEFFKIIETIFGSHVVKSKEYKNAKKNMMGKIP